jgi:hypothetical protein
VRRLLTVVALLLAAAPASASADRHVLTGTDANGHPARLVVDAHLHPVSARLYFRPNCPSPDHYADGSVHAQGGASFEHGALISGSSRSKICQFSARFVVKEAHG